MLHIPKIDDYLKILTDEEVDGFAATKFSKQFKSARKEQNLRKVAKSLLYLPNNTDEVEKYVQSSYSNNCIHRYNVEILNIFDLELQLINSKQTIKKN